MRGCFAVRAALVVAVCTIALLVYGINEIMQAGKYSQPKVMSYEQFVQQKPEEGWYRITGAFYDLTGGIHFHREFDKDDINNISEIYVPVFSVAEMASDSKSEPKVKLIVQTRNPGMLETYRSFGSSSGSMSKEQVLDYLKQHADQIYVRKDVEGMVKSGLNSEDSDKTKELAKLSANLDPDYVLLEEGKKPSMLVGLGLTALGLLLGVGQVLYYISRAGGRITGRA
jgi:hypothetical protein